MFVVIFDRVFDRDDVMIEFAVDVVDHRGERGGFARSCRTGHKEQTAGASAETLDDGRQTDVVKAQKFVGDLPQHYRDVALGLENGHAKTGGVAEGKPKVGSAFFLNFLLISFGRNGLHQRHGVFGFQDLGFQISQSAMNAKHRRSSDVKMQVRTVSTNTCFEQSIDLNSSHRLSILRNNSFRLGDSSDLFGCGDSFKNLNFSIFQKRFHTTGFGSLPQLVGRGAFKRQIANLIV